MFYFKDCSVFLYFFLFVFLINSLYVFTDNEHVEVGYGGKFLGDQESKNASRFSGHEVIKVVGKIATKWLIMDDKGIWEENNGVPPWSLNLFPW